jgi:hypothetical protein
MSIKFDDNVRQRLLSCLSPQTCEQLDKRLDDAAKSGYPSTEHACVQTIVEQSAGKKWQWCQVKISVAVSSIHNIGPFVKQGMTQSQNKAI